MTIFRYARVSTDGQSINAQVKALRAAGAEKVFRETSSGAKGNRREPARALASLGDGDTLLVNRVDRLTRPARDLLNTFDEVARARGGHRSLNDTCGDTKTAHGRLMLTVLGGLAEFEPELIRAHTDVGRERTKRRGVHTGRPPALSRHQREEAREALANRTATQADLARRFKVSQITISRLGDMKKSWS